MFKRLYHSGSNAYYTAVTWKGDEGGGLNYWGNVENALNTAPILKELLSPLTGKLTVAAHSLGNMVVGEAIQNHSFTPDNYFMLNPAVPTEAYDAGQLAGDENNDTFNDMSHPDWHPYLPRLWSTDWHKLFLNDDGRNKLTWGNKFSTVTSALNVHSFYSTGEEVLAHSLGEAPSSLGAGWDALYSQNVWVTQEKFKGRDQIGAKIMTGVAIGGWGFNCDDYSDTLIWDGLFCDEGDVLPVNVANVLSDSALQERPFFTKANQGLALYDENGSAVAKDFRNHLLSRYVPALSHAAGSTKLVVLVGANDENTDMMTIKKGWPKSRGATNVETGWRHSDAKDIAYRYVYQLYDTWVTKGKLNK